MSIRTGWKRIDQVIRWAEYRELDVEVDDRSDPEGEPHRLCSISVEIRQKVDPERTDVLASMQRSACVRLHWCWIHRNGTTPRLATAAARHSIFGEESDLVKEAKVCKGLSVYDLVAIRIQGMAESQERHP